MRTPLPWLLPLILCVVAIMVPVAGCTREGGASRADPNTSGVRAVAAGSAAGAVDSGLDVADAGPILAWTDEQATRQLARSCAFTPPAAPGELGYRPRSSPLSCRLDIEQACVADPCFHEDETQCKQECATTCDGCGASCVTSCETCKSSCKDDACRLRCAASCGRCRQDCLTTRDRCSTAHCTEVYKQCRKNLVSSWLAKGCDAVCARCTRQCPDGECDCWKKGTVAVACNANPMLCPEMNAAPERRELDPVWKANHCEDACGKIWACAKTACASAKDGCGEPAKMFVPCSQRVAGAGACKLVGLDGMMRCPEPQEE